MSASFLHGVEVIETTVGPLPVSVVKSAVIGLIGSAPRWAAGASPAAGQTPTLVSSQSDAATFGPLIKGYTIPYALNAIQEQGAGQAIVINVFNPATHNTAVAATAFSFPASGKPQVINLGHMGILGPNGPTGVGTGPAVTNAAGSTTYVEGTDYNVDYVNGLITALPGGAITAGEAIKVVFSYCDPSKVADADICGAVTGTPAVYSGIQALLTTFNSMGFVAKILIAPRYSQDQTVAAALDAAAQSLRAIALVDSPPSTAVATAIANRGLSGNAFDTSSKRTVLCFPQQKFTDNGIDPTKVTLDVNGNPVTTPIGATAVAPYSEWVAGAIAAMDLADGYWYSPSNQQIDGILGGDVAIQQGRLDDPTTDPNQLNAAGILTIFNAFGTGLRTWGNRSAAYPTSTAPDNFICIRRTLDVIEESIELATLQFLDLPINNALITQILATVNAFIRTLIQRGALEPGSAATYNPADNPPSQLAAGQLVFELNIMPPPPAERITYNTFVDINLLSALGNTTAAQAT